ncbi:MAG: zinc metallopeptidase [Chloroflexi bacterium]|nr:MAG: zinc metallopeptidase [Chloroflexota bacterium]
MARPFDLCPLGEGRLRHQPVRIRLRAAAPRPAGAARGEHRAGRGPAYRPLRPPRQGAVADPRLLASGAHPSPAQPATPHLSVASAAVIAHEVGHALQDRQGDPWMVARQSIVPAVQLGSGVAPWLIIAGVWLKILGLAWIGLIAFGAAVAFTFVTLPVEIGASSRALTFVASLGLNGERQVGARDVLKAAAWTYVAAALASLLTFLYYLMLIMGRRD